ncbi:CopG family ribbon-helix-helix protein [Acinetobacter defluvii]|uniref:CopG family ribbon-helix-helix protein n=1 Tax=Acinetobacter defluvii TaxID=1871111 RepID=UPI003AF829AD
MKDKSAPKTKLVRIRVTVPEVTLLVLDQKSVDQHYGSRSQAIVDMIHKHLIAEQDSSNAVMVGTLTLLYSLEQSSLRDQLFDLQKQFLTQVISSLHIQLDEQKILQVMLMQGVSSELRQISAQFIAFKGVIKGHLELMDAVMPPILQNSER